MDVFAMLSRRKTYAAALAVFACCVCCGCAETPQGAYTKIIGHGQKGEFDKVWDRIDSESQKQVDSWVEVFGGIAAAFTRDPQKAEELRSLRGKELFVKLCESNEGIADRFRNRRVQSAEVEGDRATLVVLVGETGEAKHETVNMVREDGVWKLDFPPAIRTPWR